MSHLWNAHRWAQSQMGVNYSFSPLFLLKKKEIVLIYSIQAVIYCKKTHSGDFSATPCLILAIIQHSNRPFYNISFTFFNTSVPIKATFNWLFVAFSYFPINTKSLFCLSWRMCVWIKTTNHYLKQVYHQELSLRTAARTKSANENNLIYD